MGTSLLTTYVKNFCLFILFIVEQCLVSEYSTDMLHPSRLLHLLVSAKSIKV